MTEENQTEGKVETGGEQSANPVSSSAQSQPSSGDLAQTIASLQKKLDAQDGEIRALKGGKDKAVDRVEKSNAEMLERFAKYLNVDAATLQDAQRQSVLDDLIAERMRGPQPEPTPQGSGSGQGAKVELFDLLKQYGLNENDPDVANALSGAKNSVEAENAILKVVVKRANKPIPDASASTAAQGKPAQSANLESLTAQYQKDMLANRGNRFALDKIKADAKKAGVPVDTIVFT